MPLDLSDFVNPLKALLSAFQMERHFKVKLKQEEETKRKEALEAILEALTATRVYVESHGEKYDREREYELSELWAIAAIRCRRTLESMQSPSFTKAEYWLHGIKYPDYIVKEMGIDLETMEAQFRDLVTKK